MKFQEKYYRFILWLTALAFFLSISGFSAFVTFGELGNLHAAAISAVVMAVGILMLTPYFGYMIFGGGECESRYKRPMRRKSRKLLRERERMQQEAHNQHSEPS